MPLDVEISDKQLQLSRKSVACGVLQLALSFVHQWQ